MSYATAADLALRFGEAELAQLADPLHTGEPDAAVLALALADADAEIDGYLVALYALPLASVPALLVRMACDLARYRLFGDRVTDQVRQLYTDAVRDLKAIASGAMRIDGAAPLAPSSASTTIKVSAPAPIFGGDGLGAY